MVERETSVYSGGRTSDTKPSSFPKATGKKSSVADNADSQSRGGAAVPHGLC
jgi:hypothetical protein